MRDNGKGKDRQKRISRKRHLMEHETVTARKLLCRKHRRKSRLDIKQNPDDAIKPVGKDYKTGGWETR